MFLPFSKLDDKLKVNRFTAKMLIEGYKHYNGSMMLAAIKNVYFIGHGMAGCDRSNFGSIHDIILPVVFFIWSNNISNACVGLPKSISLNLIQI